MKTDQQLRKEMRATPAGQLLSRMGLDYYDTESTARRVAEEAAKELHAMKITLEDMREIVCRDFLPQIARMTCQNYGQLNDALLRATVILGPYKGSGVFPVKGK